MLKFTGPLVPAPVVTVIPVVPVAVWAMVKVADIWVALMTTTLVTVIEEPAETVAPEENPDPISPILIVLPACPEAGETDVRVGTAGGGGGGGGEDG